MSRKALVPIELPDVDPATANEAARKKYVDDQVALASGGAVPPTGVIQMFAGAAAPTGWLLCDGTPIPAGNTALIALIGANTPDLRGRMPVGVGTFATLLQTDTTSTEANRTPVHTHGIASAGDHDHGAGTLVNSPVQHQGGQNTTTTGSGNRITAIAGQLGVDGTHNHTISGRTGTTGAHTHGGTDPSGRNQLPYFGINFIIKT